MATKIEWAEETWNPITGCTKISEGCQNCYAKRMAKRLAGRYGYPKDDPFKVTFHKDRLGQPLRWKKPCKIFTVSMGDMFHPDVDDYWLLKIWSQMCVCYNFPHAPRHTFLVLTKRPERMADWVFKFFADEHNNPRPVPSNIWLGVTAENQKRANERIPILLQIPAAVRFVSFEPLLSNIDPVKCGAVSWGPCGGGGESGPVEYDGQSNIDWAIVGAETGPGKRTMETMWARHIRDWCVEFKIPFLFKKDSTGSRLLDGKTWDQYPKTD